MLTGRAGPGHAVRIEIPAGGPPRQLAVEYGGHARAAGGGGGGSFRHALLLFAGGLDPEFSPAAVGAAGNVLEFGQGLHRLAGGGVLQVIPAVIGRARPPPLRLFRAPALRCPALRSVV